ncbi:MAG: NAD-dependent epimerase/dehydratase family protein [Butyrivibrio sp.]|nr:NAD-dependent epimerase/dehydratase family protein [Butyrivibrio sp.]
MKILVVGGTRFFGIPMVNALIDAGHDVTVATRGNNALGFGGSVKHIIMDRTDAASVKRAVKGESFDVVIDKVAYSSNDVRALLPNIKCDRYIQMSTCSVYKKDALLIGEEEFDAAKYPLVWADRTEDYDESKRQAERAAYEFMDAGKCVFVRYPIVMGENDYTGRFRFYVEHVMNEAPMHVDDLDYGISFIHEKEAGEFIAFLVGADVYGPINGCSKGIIKISELIGYIEKKTGKAAVYSKDGDEAPYNGLESDMSFDTRKASALGFEFSELSDWIYGLMDYEKELLEMKAAGAECPGD